MKDVVVFCLLMVLGAVLSAAPATAETRDEPKGPGFERMAAHFENWSHAREPEVMLEREDGSHVWGRRCGTPPPTAEFLEETRSRMGYVAEAMRGVNLEPLEFQIPLVFHIIQKADGTGRVSDERIAEQVEALNKAYKKFGAEFYVLEVNDVVKRGWYKKCLPVKRNGNLNRKFFRMTKKNAVDPARTVNIYTCRPFDDVLGLAIPAGWLAEDDKDNAVIVHHDAVTGGPFFFYDLGMTMVHEIGHYFGLWHTFHPGTAEDPIGCEGQGDEVKDTPYEAEPAFACLERDTCPQPGMDPIKNYMDYTDDYCVRKFSRGQRKRMDNMTFWYRPTLFGYE